MRLRRRTLITALPLWGTAARLPAQPVPSGRAGDGTTMDEVWSDAARGRALPLRVRWPGVAVPPGGWPVVVFSHGLGGSVEAGTVFAQDWARAGFVVLHVQHPGSDTPTLRDGGLRGLRAAASPAQLLARVQDVAFVLDEIARRHQRAAQAGSGPSAPAGADTRWVQANSRAIGMAGHSFGAHTTLALAGQRYPNGQSLPDTRIKAFAAFSPSLPPGDARAALAGVTRPMLTLTGTEDGDVIGNGATPDTRAQVFDALPAGHKAGLVLAGADHMTFAGQTAGRLERLRPRPEPARRLETQHHALLAALTTDWWRAHLLNDAAAATRLRQPAGLAAGDLWQLD